MSLVLSLFPGIGMLDTAFDAEGFTVREKCPTVTNGVPIAMGRAIASAIKRAVPWRPDRIEEGRFAWG